MMNEWIDIKDRIPKIGENVLVYGDSSGVVEIKYREDEYYDDAVDVYNKIVWNDQGIFNDIRYWMPLPEGPKDE